jgi:hypothetical protein
MSIGFPVTARDDGSVPAPADPGRVLVAGDTHGNAKWCAFLAVAAQHFGCPVVLQLGDFGYWPHVEAGQRFLDRVELVAERTGTTFVWIDGNHENHHALADLVAAGPADDGFVEVRPRVRYAPRGHRWTWDGRRFGALGGAFSIDWRLRRPGRSWWAEEVPTPADVERLGDDPLDVLVLHDAPLRPSDHPKVALPDQDLEVSRAVRRLLARALARTRPELVLHGHWHHRYSAVEEGVRIEGLASDQQGDERAFAVLDVAALELTTPDAAAG